MLRFMVQALQDPPFCSRTEEFYTVPNLKQNSGQCTVDGMKLRREKYSGDFIPYNLPELFQGCDKHFSKI